MALMLKTSDGKLITADDIALMQYRIRKLEEDNSRLELRIQILEANR